jgi:hypothetical protein
MWLAEILLLPKRRGVDVFESFSRWAKEKFQRPAIISPARSEQSLASRPSPSVIVPRSAVEQAVDDPIDLVSAVDGFVNAMLNDGLYTRFEINQKAMQVCRADLYLAEVNNGGHSQFIHNCNVYGSLADVIADARGGLAAMGAHGQLAALDKMAGWVAEHPDEAEQQTGFEGGRDDFLDTLDDLFYEADKAASMLALSARWIVSWPELKIVDDADCDDAIRQLAMANPLRESRLLHRSVGKLASQMIGWRDVGIGLACANAPGPEVKLALGMGRVLDVEGEKQMAYHLRTNAKEPRLCVATATHAAIYEYIATDPPVARLDENPFAAGAPRVGRKLGHVEAQAIATVIDLAEAYHAPAAVDLLLRKAGFDPTKAVVSANSVVPRDGGAVVNWVVLADGHAFHFQSTPNGGVLLRGGREESLVEAHSLELQEHFDRAAAAGDV